MYILDVDRSTSIYIAGVASFQTVAIDELTRKLSLALKKVNVNQVIIAGGVSANQYLRKEVAKLLENTNIKLLVPSMIYCTDNGAMIGAAAYPLYLKKQFTTLDLNATPNAKLY